MSKAYFIPGFGPSGGEGHMAGVRAQDDDGDDNDEPQPEPVHMEGGPLTAEDAEVFTSKAVG